jgi:outer membrane protein TolC
MQLRRIWAGLSAGGRFWVVFSLMSLFGFSLIDMASAQEEGLTIEEAVRLALTRNERTQIADAQLAAAAARVKKARAFFFPDLTATGGYTRSGFDDGDDGSRFDRDPDSLLGTMTLNLSLFDARAFPLYRQAKHEHAAARFRTEEDKRLLAFEAADAFLRTLGVEQVQAAAERREAFARETLEDTRVRFEAKLVSSNDVTRAELELANAEREATLARGEAELARLQLGFLIVSEIRGPLVVPDALLNPPQMAEPERLVEEAQTRRLDLAAGHEQIEAARAFAEEPSRRIIPILGLTGQFQQEAGSDVESRSREWLIGLNLTWLLYDGGERQADRAERNALARSSALEVETTRRQVALNVHRALVDLERNRAATRQATVAAQMGERNAEEVALLYGRGLASALEVADANLQRFVAEVALVQAGYGQGLSHLNLRAALGFDPFGKEVIP